MAPKIDLSKPVCMIGLMSGTSLDGLDIVAVKFEKINNRWFFDVVAAQTISYDEQWIEKLRNGYHAHGRELIHLNSLFGSYLGAQVNEFCKAHQVKPDAVSSHGHTIYHAPDKGYTYQIGSGAHIAAITNLQVVCDFRTQDVALGGQGAPLVPMGDALLFSHIDACLNLGGFANISFDVNGIRKAFDISPCNLPINIMSNYFGKSYDQEGKIASSGVVDEELVQKLNELSYYQNKPPKSLGKEWLDDVFMPLVIQAPLSERDKIATITAHIATQIASHLNPFSQTLVTGGGVYNTHLLKTIKKLTKSILVVPTDDIIQFKEAIIFAFLGLLRLRGEKNIFSSVTGSSFDHSSGVVYST
jgi:anhydro-N-acetylmuramic acid kinase